MAENPYSRFVEDYRRANPGDTRPDQSIVRDLLTLDEESVTPIFGSYPELQDPLSQYYTSRRRRQRQEQREERGVFGEIGASLARFVDSGQMFGGALTALGGDVLAKGPGFVGDIGESIRDWGLNVATHNMRELQENAANVRFTDIADDDSLGGKAMNAMWWVIGAAPEGLAQLAPSIAATLFTSGALAPSILASTTGNNILKGAARKVLIKRFGREALEEMAEETVEKYEKKIIGSLATNFTNRMAQAGAITASIPMSAGSIASSFVDPETGEFLETTSTGSRVAAVLGGGLLSGVLDSILPADVVRRFYPNATSRQSAISNIVTKSLEDRRAAQAAVRLIAGGSKEAATEALQELIEYTATVAADDVKKFDWSEVQTDMIEGAAVGFLIGGIVDGGTTLISPSRPSDTDATTPPTPRPSVPPTPAQGAETADGTEAQAQPTTASATVSTIQANARKNRLRTLYQQTQGGTVFPQTDEGQRAQAEFNTLAQEFPEEVGTLNARRVAEDSQALDSIEQDLADNPRLPAKTRADLLSLVTRSPELKPRVDQILEADARATDMANLERLTKTYTTGGLDVLSQNQKNQLEALRTRYPEEVERRLAEADAERKKVEEKKQRVLEERQARRQAEREQREAARQEAVSARRAARERERTQAELDRIQQDRDTTFSQESLSNAKEFPMPRLREIAEAKGLIEDPQVLVANPRTKAAREQLVTAIANNAPIRAAATATSSAEVAPAAGQSQPSRRGRAPREVTEEQVQKFVQYYNGLSNKSRMTFSEAKKAVGLSDRNNDFIKRVRQVAKERGLLSETHDGNPLPRPLIKELTISEGTPQEVWDRFIAQGGAMFARHENDPESLPTSDSRWKAVIVDADTGQVHVRPIIPRRTVAGREPSPNAYFITRMNDGQETSSIDRLDPDGSNVVDVVPLLGSDRFILDSIIYEHGAPNKDIYDFSSKDAYNETYKITDDQPTGGNTGVILSKDRKRPESATLDRKVDIETAEAAEARETGGLSQATEGETQAAALLSSVTSLEDISNLPNPEGFLEHIVGLSTEVISQQSIPLDKATEPEYNSAWEGVPAYSLLMDAVRQTITGDVSNSEYYQETSDKLKVLLAEETYPSERRPASPGQVTLPIIVKDISGKLGLDFYADSQFSIEAGPETRRRLNSRNQKDKVKPVTKKMTTDLGKALEGLEKDARYPELKALASYLRKLLAKVDPLKLEKVRVVFENEIWNSRGERYRDSSGFYDTVAREIEVTRGTDTSSFYATVLHETMHALTHDRIAEFDAIFNIVGIEGDRVDEFFNAVESEDGIPIRVEYTDLGRVEEIYNDYLRGDLSAYKGYEDVAELYALYFHAIEKMSGAVQDADMTTIQSQFYEFGNLHEFISAIFENPVVGEDSSQRYVRFRDFLNNTPAPQTARSSGPMKSLLTRAYNAIKRLLGIKQGSTLERAFNAIETTISLNRTPDFLYDLQSVETRVDEGASPRYRPLTEDEKSMWKQTISNLATLGVNVELLQQQLNSPDLFRQGQNGSFSRSQRAIRVVLEDVANPNIRNFRTLIHEVGHAILGRYDGRLIAATNRAATKPLDDQTANARVNPEETLVEAIAIELENEGFVSGADSIAASIVRYIKTLYYRVAGAVYTAMTGGQISPELQFGYFTAIMRQFIAGDKYAIASLAEIIGPDPTPNQILQSTPHSAVDLPEVTMGPQGRILGPDPLPFDFDEVMYSVEARNPPFMDTNLREQKVERLTLDVAVNIELGSVLQQAYEAALVGSPDLTWEDFLAYIGERDPAEFIEKAIQNYPELANVELDNLSDAYRDQAAVRLTQMFSKIETRLRDRKAKIEMNKASATESINELHNSINRMQNDPNNKELLNTDLRKRVAEIFSEISNNVRNGVIETEAVATITALAGELPSGFSVLSQPVIDAFTKLSSATSDPFKYVQALTVLDVNYRRSGATGIKRAVKNYSSDPGYVALRDRPELQAEVREALVEMNNDPALLAVAASIVKSETLRAALIRNRIAKIGDKVPDLSRTIDQIKKANDIQIQRMMQELADARDQDSARNVIKKEMITLRNKLRGAKRSLTSLTKREVAVDIAIPLINQAFEQRAAELGYYHEFDGRPGSEFMVMKPQVGTERDANVTLDLSNREGTLVAVQKNQQWLALNEDQKDTVLYRSIEQTNFRLLHTLFGEDKNRIRTFFGRRVMESMTDRLERTGVSEARAAAAMMKEQDAVETRLTRRFSPFGRKVSVSHSNMMKALGYKSQTRFNEQIYNPVISMVERLSSSLLSESELVAEAGHVIYQVTGKKVDPKLVSAWLNDVKETSQSVMKAFQEFKLSISDERLTTIDPVTGKEVPMARTRAVEQGAFTVPREVNQSIVNRIARLMRNSIWDRIRSEDSKAVISEIRSQLSNGEISLEQALEAYLSTTGNLFGDAELNRLFVDPIIADSGKMFRETADFFSLYTENQDNFASYLVGYLAEVSSELDPVQVLDEAIRHTNEFVSVSSAIRRMSQLEAAKDDSTRRVTAGHFISDARTGTVLPSAFFKYMVFDPTTLNKIAGDIGFQYSSGRSGIRFDAAIDQAKAKITGQRDQYATQDLGTDKAVSKQQKSAEELLRILEDTRKTYYNVVLKSDSSPFQDIGTFKRVFSLAVSQILNTVTSSLLNTFSATVGFFFAYKGLNSKSIKATGRAWTQFIKSSALGFLESFGIAVENMSNNERYLAELSFKLRENSMRFSDFRANIGRGEQFAGLSGKLARAVNVADSFFAKSWTVGEALDFMLPDRKHASARTWNAMKFNLFTWTAQNLDYALAVAALRDYENLLDSLSAYMDRNNAWNDPKFKARSKNVVKDLASRRYFGKGTDITIETLMEQLEARLGTNIETLARARKDRKEQGQPLVSERELDAVFAYASDEISYNASKASRPGIFFNNAVQPFTTFLGWGVRQTEGVFRLFEDGEGQNTSKSYIRGTMAMLGAILPLSVMFGALMDWTEEEIIGRTPNRRPVNMNPLDAEAYSSQNFLAMIERFNRVGTFGMGGELINGIVNWTDAHAAQQKALSLDDRILVFNMIHGFLGVARSVAITGEITYAQTWRPLLTAAGGNGMLQAISIYNNFSDDEGGLLANPWFEQEKAIRQRSNIYNSVRAAARVAGLELRAAGGSSSPTPRSVWVREMQLAAMADNREAFRDAWAKAVETVLEGYSESDRAQFRKEGKSPRREAENAIRQSWRGRHPVLSMLKSRPTPSELSKLLRTMPEGQRQRAEEAIRLFDRYSATIGVNTEGSRRSVRPLSAPLFF